MTMKPAFYKRKGVAKSSLPTKSEMKKQLDSDSHFCYNMTVLIGSLAELETRDGTKYDGVFVAFSGQQELMLEATHMIEENTESLISTHFDSIIVPSDKVAAVTFQDVDLSYATRDFQIDGSITGSRGLPLGEKEFKPWDGADTEPPEGCYLDSTENRNGWEVQEMFKKNEKNFGIVSDFSKDMTGYTTKLDKSDLETFKKHEEQAIQVALEIEGNTTSMDRAKLENVENEEEAFSAVVRVQDTPAASSGNGKYIPPSKRHPPAFAGESGLGNRGSASSSNGPVPQVLGGGMPTKKVIYSSNVRGNYGNSPAPGTYHDRRHHDPRRPPPLTQQLQSDHQDFRRIDDSSLSKNKKILKGRPDMAKTAKGLHDFHQNFTMQLPNDGGPGKRTVPNQQQQVKSVQESMNSPPVTTSGQQKYAGGRGFDEEAEGSGLPTKQKEESSQANHKSQLVSKPTEAKDSTKLGDSSVQSEKAATSTEGNDKSVSMKVTDNKTEYSAPATESKPEVTTQSSEDLKSRKFSFNVHAKEFNPCARAFTPSSTTPPRSMNEATSNAHLHGSPAVHSYIPMQTLMYNPQTGIVQGPSPPAPGGNSQRPVPHRKGGLIGVGQRAELPQQMPVQPTVPSLIPSTSLQHNGSHSHYAILPYSQVRLHNPNMVPIYTEATGGPQVQLPVHYYQHGGSPGQGNSNQHTQAGNAVNISVQNPHGYPQNPHPYPFLGIQMGWNPSHSNSQQVAASAYVPHGGNAGIPHG